MAEPLPEEPLERRTSLPMIGLVGLVVASIVGVGYYLAASQPKADQAGDEPVALPTPQLGEGVLPPGPLSFRYESDGETVTFSWDGYDHYLASDTYTWRLDDKKVRGPLDDPAVTVPVGKNPTCIEVRVDRADGSHGGQPFWPWCTK